MSNDAQLLLVNSESAGSTATLILGGDEVSTSTASGFTSTEFGTPASSVDITCVATGAAPSTAFGSPYAAYDQYGAATTVGNNTHFGTPNAPHAATSLGAVTHFGNPTSNLLATALGPTVHLGSPRVTSVKAATTVGRNTTFGTGATKLIAVGWLTTHIPNPQREINAYGRLFTQDFGEALGFVVQVATGIAPTTAFGTGKLIPRPVGFCTTHISAPSTPLPATGWESIAWGTHVGRQSFLAFSIDPAVQFGSVFTEVDVTAEATGKVMGGLGRPIVLWQVTFPTHWITTASDFRSTVFGTPVCPSLVVGEADGIYDTHLGRHTTAHTALAFSRTQFGTPARTVYLDASGALGTTFGTPSYVAVCEATGLRSTTFGSPYAPPLYPADGFVSTTFGTAAAKIKRPASSVYRATRWGKARAIRTRDFRAYGFRRTWVGHPSSTNHINHTTTGWRGSALGSPAGDDLALYARVLSPRARLGKPSITRNPKC